VIKATSKGKKDKKKAKKGAVDPTNGEPDGSAVAEALDGEGVSISKGPVEMTAEDLADEDRGPTTEKKKDKKGKGKKSKRPDEVEHEDDGLFFNKFAEMS
jgi:translation initiation factor 5B